MTSATAQPYRRIPIDLLYLAAEKQFVAEPVPMKQDRQRGDGAAYPSHNVAR